MTSPAAVTSADCQHENWTATATMFRDRDTDDGPVIAWSVELTMACVECGAPMLWLGLPFDALPGRPTVNPAGIELSLPCRPHPPGVRA